MEYRIKTPLLLAAIFSVLVYCRSHCAEQPDPIRDNIMQTTGIAKGTLNPGKRGINLRPAPKVMIIPIDDKESTKYGMIDAWQQHYVERRLRRAKDEKFDLVILEINTYGGSVDACRRINTAIANCPVPVIAYVKDIAFSGGALISLGSQMVVMTPSSQVGGAKVITLFGDLPDGLRQKEDALIRADVISLCDANRLKSPDGKLGYPVPIAVGMVNSDAEVIEVNDTQNRFLLGNEYDALKVKPDIVKKWKSKGTIMSLAANEAVNVGFASGLAADYEQLYLGLGVTPAFIDVAEVTPAERIARFLSNPIWSVLLVLIGLVALVWELKSPGHGVGYIVFAFCLGFFFWLQVFADNAGLIEILLFGLGAAIIAVEVFILPTFGVGLFVGFALVILSLILAFVPEGVDLWKVLQGRASNGDVQLLKEGLFWATLTILILVGSVITGLVKGAKLPGLSRMALQTEMRSTTTDFDAAAVGGAVLPRENEREALIGKTADTETVLRPAGKVRLAGTTYDAVSEGDYVDAGAKVVVLRVSAGTLVVRAV
jgi:membrane-bound serine protease (ClpP class)